jgi:hypothetical protein
MSDLVKHLLSKGLTQEQAEQIASGYSEETVQSDDLVNALSDLSKAMKVNDGDKKMSKKQPSLFDKGEDGSSSEDDEEEDDEEDEDESESEDKMSKAMKEMAKGTDAILDAMDKQYKAMLKAVEACTKEMKALRENVNGSSQSMEKSLKRALLEPVPPRSVDFNKVPYVQDTVQTPKFGTQDVINKALTMVKSENDWGRKAELTSAISRLSAGADPVVIANDFRIDMK